VRWIVEHREFDNLSGVARGQVIIVSRTNRHLLGGISSTIVLRTPASVLWSSSVVNMLLSVEISFCIGGHGSSARNLTGTPRKWMNSSPPLPPAANDRLTTSEYIGYALSDTASNFFFQTFNIFLTYYNLDVWGIRDTRSANARKQTVGSRIEEEAGLVVLEGNTIEAETKIEDKRQKSTAEI